LVLITINHPGGWSWVVFFLMMSFFPPPQSVTAMGSPTNASSSRSFTDRQAMGSAASTAKTTPRASAVRGAGRDFTGTETETAACPAIVTPKVAGERGQKGRGKDGGEKGKKGEKREGRRTGRP
jgi:hypothetical protein